MMGMKDRVTPQLGNEAKAKSVPSEQIVKVLQGCGDIIPARFHAFRGQEKNSEIGGHGVGTPYVIGRPQAMVITGQMGGLDHAVSGFQGLIFDIDDRSPIRFFPIGKIIVPQTQVRNRPPGLGPKIRDRILLIVGHEIFVIFPLACKTE
jgi:hypothetical protein